MKPSIKKEWVAALRSGKYKQGTGALNKNGKFCCLGVLCDLYAKRESHGAKWRKAKDGDGKVFFDGGEEGNNRQQLNLTKRVADWAGVKDTDPKVDGVYLATLNDRGTPFNKIAGLIQENL